MGKFTWLIYDIICIVEEQKTKVREDSKEESSSSEELSSENPSSVDRFNRYIWATRSEI